MGEGKTHERFLPDMKPNFRDKNNARRSQEEEIPEDAQIYVAFKARIILAFQEILTPLSYQPPPLIVSHGGVFWVLTTLLGNTDTNFPMGNCALYFF